MNLLLRRYSNVAAVFTLLQYLYASKHKVLQGTNLFTGRQSSPDKSQNKLVPKQYLPLVLAHEPDAPVLRDDDGLAARLGLT